MKVKIIIINHTSKSFRFKARTIFKSNDGFTLAEIITVLGITAVLIAAMTMFFAPARKLINDYTRDAYIETAMYGICDYIQKSIQGAKTVLITENISDFIFDSIDKNGVKCLVVYKRAGGKTRLCDLTPNKDDRIKYVDLPGYFEDDDVFSEAYYCMNNYKFFFTVKKGNIYDWLEIKLEAYTDHFDNDEDGYGEKATPDMIRTFRMLDENTVIRCEVSSFNPDKNIYILYN